MSTTKAETYLTLKGDRAVSIRVVGTDPATTTSVLITRSKSGRSWEAWHSDRTSTIARGSFRHCVTRARQEVLRRHG